MAVEGVTATDLNVAQVRDSVAGAGHRMPEASIRSRRQRLFGALR